MLKIALKDLKLFFSDRKSLMLTFAVPIALITLFAFAFGGVGQKKREARPTTIVVADEDHTTESRNIISQLDSLNEFEVYQTTSDTAIMWVKTGEEPTALIFHKGFRDSLLAGKQTPVEFQYDGAREAEAGILQGALISKLMRFLGTQSMSSKVETNLGTRYPEMDSESRAGIHEQIMQDMGPKDGEDEGGSWIKATPVIAQEANSPGLIHAVAGTAIMMLLFSVTGMGASMLDEKQEGTLKKLLYSPLPKNSILFGKVLSTNLICIMQLTIMFLFARLAFGLILAPKLPSLIVMIVATAYACSAFGVLLASFAKTRQQVQAWSTLIILIMSCIGGSMVPSFMMPEFMQRISIFSVNYWGIQGFYDIFWRDLPVNSSLFLTKPMVLVIIGTVLNLVAVQMFRRNVLKIA
jgi:ABC-2 type transport system permease protein